MTLSVMTCCWSLVVEKCSNQVCKDFDDKLVNTAPPSPGETKVVGSMSAGRVSESDEVYCFDDHLLHDMHMHMPMYMHRRRTVEVSLLTQRTWS